MDTRGEWMFFLWKVVCGIMELACHISSYKIEVVVRWLTNLRRPKIQKYKLIGMSAYIWTRIESARMSVFEIEDSKFNCWE